METQRWSSRSYRRDTFLFLKAAHSTNITVSRRYVTLQNTKTPQHVQFLFLYTKQKCLHDRQFLSISSCRPPEKKQSYSDTWKERTHNPPPPRLLLQCKCFLHQPHINLLCQKAVPTFEPGVCLGSTYSVPWTWSIHLADSTMKDGSLISID